jgi:CRISPR/Cas system-associated exonuclease Cas4 (RecB family)
MIDPLSDPVDAQTFGPLDTKHTVFSFSRLKTYDQCAAKYKFTYIDKLPQPTGPAAERGKMIHAEIEELVKGKLPLYSEITEYLEPKILEWRNKNAQAELEFAVDKDWNEVPYDSKQARFRGVIDLYYEEDNVATVLDHKTGKERDYADQLITYATVIFSIKPHIDNILPVIEFIDKKKTVKYDAISKNKLGSMKVDLGFKFMAIENDNIFAPNPGYLCNYCHYRKNNGGPCKW